MADDELSCPHEPLPSAPLVPLTDDDYEGAFYSLAAELQRLGVGLDMRPFEWTFPKDAEVIAFLPKYARGNNPPAEKDDKFVVVWSLSQSRMFDFMSSCEHYERAACDECGGFLDGILKMLYSAVMAFSQARQDRLASWMRHMPQDDEEEE